MAAAGAESGLAAAIFENGKAEAIRLGAGQASVSESWVWLP